jgi:sigma-B regulation protein RsbU (phosphoserine phosphatase)
VEKERDTLPVPPRHETRPARSWLGVPLMIQDRVSGVLSVQSFKPHAFSAGDERFLIAVGQHAALALENARLYATAAQRTRELESMNQVHRILAASLDPNEIFRKAARALADTFGYSRVTLSTYQEDRLTLQAQIGYERQEWDPALAMRAARSAQTALGRATRPETDPRAAPGAIKQIAVPIRHDQRVLGVLAIEARGETSLTDEDVRMVGSFADYLAIAIANAVMYQSVVERERVLANTLAAVRS